MHENGNCSYYFDTKIKGIKQMKAVEVLNNHKLKRTSCREGIIEVVTSSDYALSENEIKEKLQGNYDRTTFYRSFKTLEEHNILHKIVVDNQNIKYAYNKSTSKEIEHIHFYCEKCQSVKCIETEMTNKYNLPEGYSFVEADILIKGLCSKCKL
ncbi:MAG: transcriptional repressor [Saprospiraceae bacterium]